MSFLFSSDNRYFKVTSDATPMLTPSGVDDYYAAVKIQRWWRKSKETIVFSGESYRQYSDSSSSSRERSTTSEDSMYVNTYGLRKRKLEDIDDDNIESQESVEPQSSSSESNTNRDYESTDDDSDMEVEDETRLVNNNNFLYDFFTSFLSFFMRLFGLN